MSVTEYYYFQSGLVFGIPHISGFVAACAFSLVGHKFSSRIMAFLGSFMHGLSAILFGLLQYTDDTVVFLALSYLLRKEAQPNIIKCKNNSLILNAYRILEGIGSSVAMAALSAVVLKLYPNKVGQTTSCSQTALGVGYSIGPALGGFLYDIGGFHLPFIVIGVSDILFALIVLLALPPEGCNQGGKEKSENLSSAKIISEV